MSETKPEADAAADDGATMQRMKKTVTMRSFGGQTEALRCIRDAGKDDKVDGVPGIYHRLGYVWGTISKAEMKTGTLPDGSMKENILLRGDFSYETFHTGEQVNGCSEAYLPEAFASHVYAAMLDKNVSNLEFAIEVGSEPTGKSIPFQYVVKALHRPAQSEAMKRLRAMVEKAKGAVLPAPEPAPALSAPETETKGRKSK